MNADEVLVFPAGVRTGFPFSAPIDAVTWLCNAAAGAFGPMSTYVLGLDKWAVPVQAIMRPLYPRETPYPIPESDDITLSRHLSTLSGIAVVTDHPVLAVEQWSVDGFSGIGMDASILSMWRTAIGGEVLTRGYFDAADKPDRRAAAQVLGAYEALTESTGATLVAFVNRWISTAWADALNGPLPVVPDPTPGHVVDATFTQTAVGTVRIGIPTLTQ